MAAIRGLISRQKKNEASLPAQFICALKLVVSFFHLNKPRVDVARKTWFIRRATYCHGVCLHTHLLFVLLAMSQVESSLLLKPPGGLTMHMLHLDDIY